MAAPGEKFELSTTGKRSTILSSLSLLRSLTLLVCSDTMWAGESRHEVGSSKLVMRSSTRRQVIDSSMNTSLSMLITDQLGELIEWLLPASPGLRVHQLIATSDELTLLMASTHSEACCPLCGQSSARVHSHYTRTDAGICLGQRSRYGYVSRCIVFSVRIPPAHARSLPNR
jgi:hypothetical protein